MKGHVTLWLALLLAAFLLTPLFLDPASVVARVNKDVAAHRVVLGTKITNQLVGASNYLHKVVFFDSSASQPVHDSYVKQEQFDQTGALFAFEAPARFTNQYLKAFEANTYSMVFRVLAMLAWVPFFLPFMIAVMVDAHAIRRIKLVSFQYSSPMLYSVGLHASIFCVFLPFFMIIVPLHFSPLAIPVWALTLCAFLTVSIQNVQRITSSAKG